MPTDLFESFNTGLYRVEMESDVPQWLKQLARPSEAVDWALLAVAAIVFLVTLGRRLAAPAEKRWARAGVGLLLDVASYLLAVVALFMPWYGTDVLGTGLGAERNAFNPDMPLG